MKPGLLNDAAVQPEPKFGEAGEWAEIDYLVKDIRFKVADRKTITTAQGYRDAINVLAQNSHYTSAELRAAVKRQLKSQYLPRELSRRVTDALKAALSEDA